MRVDGEISLARFRGYIAQNPVRAGLAAEPNEFPWCFEFLRRNKAQGLKPQNNQALCGPTEVVP
jgi:hypothetical protein